MSITDISTGPIWAPTPLKTFTRDDVVKGCPDFVSREMPPEDWSGTAVDLLEQPSVGISTRTKLYIVLFVGGLSRACTDVFTLICVESVKCKIWDARARTALEQCRKFLASGRPASEIWPAWNQSIDAANRESDRAVEAFKRETLVRRSGDLTAIVAAAEETGKIVATVEATDAVVNAVWVVGNLNDRAGEQTIAYKVMEVVGKTVMAATAERKSVMQWAVTPESSALEEEAYAEHAKRLVALLKKPQPVTNQGTIA